MMMMIRLCCVLVASLTAIVAFLLQIGVVPSSKARPTLRRVPLHHRFGDATSSYFHSRKSVLSLYPGELPGYTGWARTDQTLAGNFVIQGFRPAIAGREWFVDVACSDNVCRRGGSAFYLRAYGPAVVAGTFDDHMDGSYRLNFHFFDEGVYTIEAVLTFSNPPPLANFPLGQNETEPGYEGYLLSGFPFQIEVGAHDVVENEPTDSASQRCGMEDLVGIGDPRKGRWVVVDKVGHKSHQRKGRSAAITLEGYQKGLNSLGILMEFVPANCTMIPPRNLSPRILRTCFSASKDEQMSPHIIFIGDSVMNLERLAFENFLHGSSVTTSFIPTHGGLDKRLDDVLVALQEIQEYRPNRSIFIIFNSGLHDIAQLCSIKYRANRAATLSYLDEEFRCVERYTELLRELASFLDKYPADVVAFRTTSAGWMKYGNYGFGFRPTSIQPYSLSPDIVKEFNEVATHTIRSGSERIVFLDGYFLSLARPDHREVSENNDIGKHLVHPGPEVVNASAAIWLMVVLDESCRELMDTVPLK